MIYKDLLGSTAQMSGNHSQTSKEYAESCTSKYEFVTFPNNPWDFLSRKGIKRPSALHEH